MILFSFYARNQNLCFILIGTQLVPFKSRAKWQNGERATIFRLLQSLRYVFGNICPYKLGIIRKCCKQSPGSGKTFTQLGRYPAHRRSLDYGDFLCHRRISIDPQLVGGGQRKREVINMAIFSILFKIQYFPIYKVTF